MSRHGLPQAAFGIVGAGVLLRLLFLWLAEPLELQSDEANYVYLALSWNHFGFFSDSYRYPWPPGYPFLLAAALGAFGASAVCEAAHLADV